MRTPEEPNARELQLSRLTPQEAVRAVEQGLKPLALLKLPIETKLLCCVFQSSLVSADSAGRITRIFSENNYIYFQPGQENNAERVKELVIEMNNQKCVHQQIGELYVDTPIGDAYHIELGKLLGYSDEEIDQFIDHPGE